MDLSESLISKTFLVGRCWLSVSKPESNARLVSALETEMCCKRCFQCQHVPLHLGHRAREEHWHRKRFRGRASHGRPVQAEPIKPMLNALGTKRSTPRYDNHLSYFAVTFNVRRYTMEHLPAFCIWKQGVMCGDFSGTSYESIQFNVARYVESCTLKSPLNVCRLRRLCSERRSLGIIDPYGNYVGRGFHAFTSLLNLSRFCH
jgi:hypothetical protein